MSAPTPQTEPPPAPAPAPAPHTVSSAMKWVEDRLKLISLVGVAFACVVVPMMPGSEWQAKHDRLKQENEHLREKAHRLEMENERMKSSEAGRMKGSEEIAAAIAQACRGDSLKAR